MLNNKENFNLLSSEELIIPVISYEKDLNGNKKSVKSNLSLNEIFSDKKIVIFGLPGAYTPTCSSTHLPRFEQIYDSFKKNGVDEVYCVSVNDPFVMEAWGKDEGILNTKLIADGNGYFTKLLDMLVSKEDLSFGDRSWRYSAYIENGIVVKHFVEEEVAGDPFEVSDADTMIKHINPEFVTEDDILIFTKENCSYCHELKQILKEKGLKYTEIPLNNEVRNKVLRAMSPDDLVVPQVFVNGKRYSGLENFKKAS